MIGLGNDLNVNLRSLIAFNYFNVGNNKSPIF
jgi:hypothetical protein